MSGARRPLTYAGGDVALLARMSDGRVRVVYLDRSGQPTQHKAAVWTHHLRGVGWHMAAIREAIKALPPEHEPPPAPQSPPASTGTAAPRPSQPPRGGGFLFIDHAIPEGDR